MSDWAIYGCPRVQRHFWTHFQGGSISTNVKSLTNVHTITEYRTYYYARVSSTGQNLTRQLEAFHKLGAEEREIITDKASGKDIGRPGYQALKTTLLRSGDTLIVTSLDRLSRKKEDIKAELQYFKEHNIRLKILDIPTTLIDPPEGQEWIFDMVLNILIEVMLFRNQQLTDQVHGKRIRPTCSTFNDDSQASLAVD